MNELVVLKPGADVQAYRASTEAADLCKDIVLATSVTIQRRQYVPVEGWQAIAIAHGCAAASRDVQRVEGGIKAVGEVRRMSDGQLISTAEGFVGEDEAVWFGGQIDNKSYPKRAEYAIRAMAQTRAISRACRSAFAHVVVMMNKGLATTPAEEVYDAETGHVMQNLGSEKVPGISKIKERLNKFMRDGNACNNLDEFKAMKRANRDDLKTIREANHSYWTGDGGDEFEGYAKWMARREAELAPVEMGETGQMCLDTLAECTSSQELAGWFKLNWKYVEELDGAERDRVEAKYQELETAFKAVDMVGAG